MRAGSRGQLDFVRRLAGVFCCAAIFSLAAGCGHFAPSHSYFLRGNWSVELNRACPHGHSSELSRQATGHPLRDALRASVFPCPACAGASACSPPSVPYPKFHPVPTRPVFQPAVVAIPVPDQEDGLEGRVPSPSAETIPTPMAEAGAAQTTVPSYR